MSGRRMTTGTITGTALLLALGVVLPIVFHMIPLGGRIFSPMHIPAFLAGLLMGPLSGLVVGIGSPVLSGLLTGRPTFFYMIPMLFELGTYGLVAGLLRPWIARMMGPRVTIDPGSLTPGAVSAPAVRADQPVTGDTEVTGGLSDRPVTNRQIGYAPTLVALIGAMVVGRVVWFAVVVWLAPLLGIQARSIALALGALGAGWIGMAIHIAIIPALVRSVEVLRSRTGT